MMSVYVKLAVFGLALHLILFYSIFDIYYSSPLIQGTQPHVITSSGGPARRIVIFSADGLRASSFFDNADKSPFLHGIINSSKTSWGVSVSHVPTESRPGHVAILAGFYEDVSAVTRGWKRNPVPFDSIINRSSEAWAWGSPDIVSMFTDEVHHAHPQVYSEQLEDFAASDASKLDHWVFNKVEEFFNASSVNNSLVRRMEQKGSVYFLHLLGLDTNGHGNKPRSDAYINNIAVVDTGVETVSNLFNEHFNDNRTAFVFTSDHGMTDWGSHGAGTDDEVLTPFVVWGAGVRTSSLKKQIKQVDLAPYMAALLGVPVPMNSIGSLPLEMLDASPKYRFQASYANLKQMLEQYTIKRKEKKGHTLSMFFSDYAYLSKEALTTFEREVRRLVELRRYEAASMVCVRLLDRVRTGIYYFHRYERRLLGTAVAIAFLSWMLLVFLVSTRSAFCMLHQDTLFYPQPKACVFLIVVLMALLTIGLPLSSCVYIMLPIYTASIAYNASGCSFVKCVHEVEPSLWLLHLRSDPLRYVSKVFRAAAFLVSIGVTLYLLTAVFTQRWLLSIVAIIMALIPHLDTVQNPYLNKWKRLWSLVCVSMAIFPLLPAVGSTPVPIICILSPLLFAGALVWLRHRYALSYAPLLDVLIRSHILTAFIILSTNYFTNSQYQSWVWSAMSLIQHCLCWVSIPCALLGPLFAPAVLIPRLVIWFAFLHIPYSLLSLSYESLFLELFFLLLVLYVRLQYTHLTDEQFLHLPLATTHTNRTRGVDESGCGRFSLWEWSRGLQLVVLIEMAFFGTGNIASLNSFNPSFLRCFVQVFSPFLMLTLLLFKILLPFLGVALAFVTVLHPSVTLSRLAHVILIITDAMALVFFMQLEDEGSWLQIGMSISHFVIAMAFSVFVFALMHVANLLLPISLHSLQRVKGKHLV